MKRVYFIPILVLPFIFCFCSKSNITESSVENGLNFYLLADSSITANQICATNINDLTLAAKPFLNYKDLKYYNWTEHSFKVDSNVVKTILLICKNNATVFGIPFIVTVDKERIYLGAFWFLYSSVAPCCPFIAAPFDDGKTSQILGINRMWDSTKTDMRKDQRIYNTLKKCGLLIE